MTLKKLRGLCLTDLQDFSPENVIPNVNEEISSCIKQVTTCVGGVMRYAGVTLDSGKREYGTTLDAAADSTIGDGFPEDFLNVEAVFDGNENQMRRISRTERLETGTGTPLSYYIDPGANRIGFDRVPDATGTVYLMYKGTGADVDEDTDVVLPEFGIPDTSRFWSVISAAFAVTYWKRKLAKGFQLGPGFEADMAVSIRALEYWEKQYSLRIVDVASLLFGKNSDQASQVDLPE